MGIDDYSLALLLATLYLLPDLPRCERDPTITCVISTCHHVFPIKIDSFLKPRAKMMPSSPCCFFPGSWSQKLKLTDRENWQKHGLLCHKPDYGSWALALLGKRDNESDVNSGDQVPGSSEGIQVCTRSSARDPSYYILRSMCVHACVHAYLSGCVLPVL